MKALGENQVQIDCDVLQADGGTRTASITGAYVALVDAMRWAEKHKHIRSADRVIKDSVSAVSVGVIDGKPMLDLPYIEDSKAMTDMNVAMTDPANSLRFRHRGASPVQPRRAEYAARSGRKGQQGTAGRTAGCARTGLKRTQAGRKPIVGWPRKTSVGQASRGTSGKPTSTKQRTATKGIGT